MGYLEKELSWVESAETWNSGGHVMLDIIRLKNGHVLIISDEAVCRYDSIDEFMYDEGDYDYDKQCVTIPLQTSMTIGKSFLYKGTHITNPYKSECGRYDVKPGSYYGFAYFESLKED